MSDRSRALSLAQKANEAFAQGEEQKINAFRLVCYTILYILRCLHFKP
jgi:hypothetical protein